MDERYKIEETKCFSELNYDDRLRLAGVFSSGDDCRSWRMLGSCLGLTNVEIEAIANKEGVTYRAMEVFNRWMPKRTSTIWVLKETLKKMEHWEAIQILEESRLNVVNLFILLEKSDEDKQKHSKKVPGLKPLIDIVRPLVNRNLGIWLIKKDSFLILRLVRSPEYPSDNTWTQPANKFKGQQINIQVEIMRKQTRPKTDPTRQLKDGSTSESGRNVISWIEKDSLYFDIQDSPEEVTSVNSVQETVIPSETSYPISVKDWETSTVSDDLPGTMANLNLTPEPSIETGEGVFGHTKQRKRRTMEEEDLSGVPGFCPSIDSSNEDNLREHLKRDGDYVIQQNSFAGITSLELRVRHNDQILRYLIERKHEPQNLYAIKGEHYETYSIKELISHYHENELHSVEFSSAGGGKSIFLARPISY